ncbi:endonuclease/exonuclease/phosphatase family protein [Fonsecaea pedrosoi]|nr:endonuclease/exonuclease/phosphatase family protein [Fonsecaea pedrosoi]
MDPKFKRIIELIESKKKSSHPWTRQQRFDQPYFSFSPETSSWQQVTPSKTASGVTGLSRFMLLSWNIDFMLPFADERMQAALKHLQSHVEDAPLPSIIMLQEMLETDLALLQTQPWIRANYNITDIDNKYWESGYYGTCTLVPKVLPIASVFRVHYEQTAMERDGLFVDVTFANAQIIRICNTHLESLIADPPKRPHQLATAAKWMHDPEVSGSVLGGDLNAIQDFDKTLHSDNNLQDAYLTLGGKEDTDQGYTWGQMAPTKLRNMFGCSRMDKLFFCGKLRCEKFERIGMGVEAEEENVRKALIDEEGMEAGWVTDHLGVKAEFSVGEVSSSKI